MKRTILFPTLLAVLLAGCTMVEPNTAEGAADDSLVRFTATTADNTKVSISVGEESPLLAWESGDKVGIFDLAEDASRNYCYNVLTTEEAAVCNLLPDRTQKAYYGTNEEQTFYAYSPYDAEASEMACEFPLSLPRVQTQSASGDIQHLRGLNFMTAQTTVTDGGAANLDFQSAFAFVRFDVLLSEAYDVNIKQLRLKSTAAPLAMASGTIDLTSGYILPIEAESDVTLAVEDYLVINSSEAQQGYMMVLPGSHAEGTLSIEVVAIDNSVATVSLPAVTFKANGYYEREVSLSIDDFVQSNPFDVTTASLSGRVGEPVLFSFSGVADAIDLFTGEEGHDFDLRNTDRYSYDSGLTLSFNSSWVNGDDINPELFRVKLSQDFSGEYTEEEVLSATWTDITDLFTLPTEVTGSSSNYVEAGEVNLISKIDVAKSCYIGLFYRVTGIPADEKVSGHGRTQIFVSRFNVNSVAEDGTITSLIAEDAIANNATMILGDEYANDQEKNYPSFKKNNTLGNYAWFSSMFQPAENMYAYMVTKAVAPVSYNLGPDKPIVVQSATDSPVSEYSYIFNEAGTYEVVFVAHSVSLTGEAVEKVKTFTITIE